MSPLKKVLADKTHIPAQFMKYCLFGGLGAATHVLTFAALNESYLPADQDQVSTVRALNFLLSNAAAFVLSTLVAYAANRAWVFQSGRHGWLKEITYFYLLNIIAFLGSTPLGSMIVARFEVSEYAVFILVVGASAMVNFVGRKYWVFLH